MPSRRDMLLGAGALVAGGGAVLGTGAFTSVQAERTASVETASDENALLSFAPNDTYGGNAGEYITESDINTMEMSFEAVNRNAVTRFENLFTVGNQGTQEIELWVDVDHGVQGTDPIWGNGYDNNGPMDILYGDEYDPTASGQGDSDSIVGGNRNQTPNPNLPTLGPGDSVDLTVIIDTRNRGDASWEDGSIQFVAE